MTWIGTINVHIRRAKRIFLPGNRSLAKAYAEVEQVTNCTRVIIIETFILFRTRPKNGILE
jgi:hypothetical protein